MALPEDILQDLEIRQSLQNRLPFPAIGGGGLNLTGYTPQYSSMVGPIATGQAYAQQIAGGIPFEQVVAPGMSFSPEQPMGYTQADLNVVNLPRDVAPVFPTPPATTGQVAQPSYPTMPYAPTGTPMPTIFGFPAPQLPQIDLSQIQIPEIDLSQITIPESVKSSIGEFLGIPQIDVSQFVTREEMPSFEMPQIPEIDVSQFVGREEIPQLLKDIPLDIPQIDTSRFVSREEIPSLLPSIPQIDTSKFITQEDIGGLRSDILGSLPQVRMPDTSQFVTQQDINAAIAGIPQVSLSDIEARLAALESVPTSKIPNLPKPLGFFS